MSEQEYIDRLKSLYKSDFDLANAFANEYHKDSLADVNTLITRAQASLGRHEGLQGSATAKNLFPLTSAFGMSESGVRNLIDMRSPSNWTRMSTKALMEAAIRGGYVKPLPEDATDAQKAEQRKNFNNFLNILGTESTDQERRNILRDYENTQFTKDPTGWAQKIINDFLFRTYSKRAKEQMLRGEGASNWSSMSDADRATLGLDIGANAMFGAGAAGAGNLIAGQGLRTAGNIMGSDLAAGVLGGLVDVGNRYAHTREGVRPYEIITEPIVAGATNTLFTPGALRAGASNAMSMMRGGKVGETSRRNVMAKAADWLANKTGWDEAELASLFKELGSNPDWRTAPMSPATRDKIYKMKEIWDDGLHDSPGETYSLYDELQQLYETSGRKPITVETKEGGLQTTFFSPEDLGEKPDMGKFMNDLDAHIADMKGALENSAGAEEAPALKRRIKYFENARDMFANGLMEPGEALHMVDRPSPFKFDRKPEFKAGGQGGAQFVLKEATTDRDVKLMREFVQKAKSGKIVDAEGTMADELARLKDKYPEFGRFVDNLNTVNLGHTAGTIYDNGTHTFGNQVSTGKFFPTRDILSGMWEEPARNAARIGTEAVLTGAVKPAVTFAGMERFSKPDNSYAAVSERIEKLRQEKPEATEAALNWQFNPRLEPSKQLTSEERNLVNQFRALQLNEAMNGR